jgi:hypothetical protein
MGSGGMIGTRDISVPGYKDILGVSRLFDQLGRRVVGLVDLRGYGLGEVAKPVSAIIDNGLEAGGV